MQVYTAMFDFVRMSHMYGCPDLDPRSHFYLKVFSFTTILLDTLGKLEAVHCTNEGFFRPCVPSGVEILPNMAREGLLTLLEAANAC